MSALRRMFEMPEEDTECLDAMGLDWETVIENTARWLIFPTYPIPDEYNVTSASAAIRIKPSYPDEDIDMVYFSPQLSLKTGKVIRQLSDTLIDSKTYQQWSRHRTAENPWRLGLDNACTHMLQVDQWLIREINYVAEIKLRLTKSQHSEFFDHLFPGDGLEAVALALCGRRSDGDRHWLMVHKIEPIPYVECVERRPDYVRWSTARLIPLLEEARTRGWAILKVHCHPNGYASFSSIDDDTDRDLFDSIATWTETDLPHASAIMLPDGRLFGRAFSGNGKVDSIQSVLVTGDDIELWLSSRPGKLSRFTQRHEQLFGAGTTGRLRHLTAAVVGCSGTGSPVIELLARLGVGGLIIVDPDVVEEKNLNRIINSTRLDSYLELRKVEVSARSIAAMGFDTSLRIFPRSLFEGDVIKAVAEADVIFGCLDSVEARNVLNRAATFYSIPYFDLGIKLESDGLGGIDEAVGAVHYLRPDGNTLLERGAYTVEQLSAEGLKRTDPNAYEEQQMAGYIGGVREDRPAVVSINCQIASMAVNEFLARLHPFRLDSNDQSAILRVNFVGGEIYREVEGANGARLTKHIGKGDVIPALSMPAFG